MKFVAIFFGSRKTAIVSSLMLLAIMGLLYVARQEALVAVRIELPTGPATSGTTRTKRSPSIQTANILIINSYHVGHVWSDNELAGIVGTLKEASPGISCLVEYLDCKRYPRQEHFERVRELFEVKYGGRNIPVVIVTDNPALEFIMKYRSRLFPRSSVVFCGVNGFKKEMIAGQKDITGLAEVLDAGNTVKAALRLHPAAKELFVIHDYTSTGLATRREAEAQLQELAGRIRVRFSEDMTKPELSLFLKNLPAHSIVLSLAFNVFRDGEVIAHEDIARLQSENAPVPVYGVHQERLGYGIVGGSLLSGKLHGAQAAGVALKILSGTPASTIPVDMRSPARLMFDYNQLARFGIPIGSLPDGSVVVNKPISFMVSHRYLIISVVLIMALLVTGVIALSVNVYRRTLAEEGLLKANEELEESRTALMEIVADLKEKTGELEEANERLKEVDRLKSAFLASMSHELRTPLNAVIGFSTILHDEWLGPVNAEQKQNIASILCSGRHLLNMINDVLDVTQIEAGTTIPVIEEFDLHDLLAEAENEVAAAIREKGLEMRSEFLRQRMRTDRRRLLQCLSNLLNNAVKFTDRGSVTVAARLVSFSGETPEEEMVEIAVTDTGIGIGEEDRSRIFQPFFRIVTPQRTIVPGAGLGLFLTRKIVREILKGDIQVSSEYGKGSRFSLKIPARLP